MRAPYSSAFKAEMVKKLTLPGGPSATSFSGEVGVSQSTLSRWMREAGGAGRVVGMAKIKRKIKSGSKRPQDWTAEEKLQAVLETASLAEEDLGGYLRQRGLHRATVDRWRGQMLRGLAHLAGTKSSSEEKRIQSLEKELLRKDKALAEAAALLVLQKKVQALWGDEDENMTPRNGR